MSTISCTEFDRLLDDLIERDGSPDERPLSQHATSCLACRDKWQRHVLVERAVANWRSQVPQCDLSETILARVAFDRPVSPAADGPRVASRSGGAIESAQRRRAWGSVAVAALAMLVATFMIVRTPTPETQKNVATAKSTAGGRGKTLLPLDEPGEDVEAFVASAGSAYYVLASDAAQAVAEASRIVAPTSRLAVFEAEPAESNDPADEAHPNGLAPIGREFGKALDFLFDAVPAEQSSST